MKKWMSLGLGVFVLLAIAGGGYIVYSNSQEEADVLSETVKPQLNFAPFVISEDSEELSVKSDSVTYDDSQQILSFTVVGPQPQLYQVSQQASPASFEDNPKSYENLLTLQNQYGSFVSTYGTVYITQGPEETRRYAAIMNSNGVLMFVRSENELSEGEWRWFFSQIEQLPTGEEGNVL